LESGRPIAHVGDDLGIHKETLRKRVRQAEADRGLRPDLPTSEEREEIKHHATGVSRLVRKGSRHLFCSGSNTPKSVQKSQ